MYQGVCTHAHTDQERHVVRMLFVDPKQNPNNMCDVRKIVLELIKFQVLYLPTSYSPKRCGIDIVEMFLGLCNHRGECQLLCCWIRDTSSFVYTLGLCAGTG
jgi:hypothetical protein